jgi:hypothetical protein
LDLETQIIDDSDDSEDVQDPISETKNPIGNIIIGMAIMLIVVSVLLTIYGISRILNIMSKLKKTSVSLLKKPSLR